MNAKLSKEDVARLLQDPSVEARADAAAKIATHYDAAENLGAEEKKLAEEIFSIMCKDAEERVRQALASNLKECPYLPHDIAVTLAHDVEAVSVPMLKYSSVLTDADLIEIVRSQGKEKQRAIVGRAIVSRRLSNALIETRDENVLGELVVNEGTDISEAAMHRLIDDFEQSDIVKESLVGRGSVPVEITERLMSIVSEELHQRLLARMDLSSDQIGDLELQSREKATLGLVGGPAAKTDTRRLIVQFYKNGRRTPTIVLRAVCMGDVDFLDASIVTLSRIPLSGARKIIYGDGDDAVLQPLEKAKLPDALRPAFQAAIEVSQETEYDGGDNDQERFRRQMIDRIITNFEDPDRAMCDDNIEYLMAHLAKIDHGIWLGL
jgi:uncharacterized protein (DUF2336 family)